VVAAAGSAVSALQPDLVGIAAPLVAVGSLAWATYVWLTDRPTSHTHTIRAPGLTLT
jgi:hypothetical protein